LKSLSRQVFVYGSGRLALQLASFVTLPILTRIFAPEDYGVMEATTTMMAAIGIAASLSLEAGAQRSYFDYTAEHERERRVVLSSAFWPMVGWATLLTVVVVLLRAPISRLLFDTNEYGTVIALAVAVFPLSVASTFFLEVMRLRQQAGRYVLVTWFGALSSVALILYLVAFQDLGLEGFYLAGVISALPTLLVALASARVPILPVVDWRELRKMLAYALPLMPVAAMSWVLQFVDRFFVLHYAGLRELGLYALGLRLSNVLLLGVWAFGLAWLPFVLDLYSREPAIERNVRARALTTVAFAIGFGAVCISVYAREFFLTVTDPAFVDAYKFVGILSAGVFALALNAVTMTGISIARRTRYFAQYSAYAAALNIALNLLLVPALGAIGAAIAMSATYVVIAVLYYRRAQILDPVQFDLRAVLTIGGIASVLIVVGAFINIEPLWASALIKLPLVLAFPVAAWVLGCVDESTSRIIRAPVSALRRIAAATRS
jgi:O-antigen/teichoic acid export membrane protein